jgi:hypothetical protein
MKTLSFLASAVLVLAGTSLSSSAACNGRTLTVEEAWQILGGSNGLCRTSMGRCYAWPVDCRIYDGTVCDQDVAYSLAYGTGETCENQFNPEDHCVEVGPHEVCLQYCHCETTYNEETFEPESCMLIIPQGGWTPDSVVGPLEVDPDIGTDCP